MRKRGSGDLPEWKSREYLSQSVRERIRGDVLFVIILRDVAVNVPYELSLSQWDAS